MKTVDYNKLQHILCNKGFTVAYIYQGNTGSSGNPPQVIISAKDKEDCLRLEQNLNSLLKDLYLNRKAAPKDILKVTRIEGLGLERYLPRYGLTLHSGRLDEPCSPRDCASYQKELKCLEKFLLKTAPPF